ncbi:hypothetical protein CUN38_04910 [Enterococcus faecium]|uniref:hypothetical protein n=1 Tax=Enterococcus faecium TaxID=1352 RepID=UPI000CF17CFD|nr:hypothetical protein [Enterococcus faecium]PQC93484.1 hypothetical protein CUN38_04910 [Enterococcus faecium]
MIISLLLLLSGIAMLGTGVYLMLGIDEAKTLSECYFIVMAGFIGLGFGLLLIIASLLAL